MAPRHPRTARTGDDGALLATHWLHGPELVRLTNYFSVRYMYMVTGLQHRAPQTAREPRAGPDCTSRAVGRVPWRPMSIRASRSVSSTPAVMISLPSWGSGTSGCGTPAHGLAVLIIPHGDREPGNCKTAGLSAKPHYPSRGSGTAHGKRRTQAGRPTHYPAWGSGTRTGCVVH